MINLKLRGFVTPEDFEGTDGERIQKALDLAKKEDILKVVLTGDYNAEGEIVIPSGTHLVLDNAVLRGNIANEVVKNFSFESNRIYIEGKNSIIKGNINFLHTRHVVIEKLKIDGNLTVLVSSKLRIEDVEMTGEFTIGRGCKNCIIQRIKCKKAIINGTNKGYDVLGRDFAIVNILLRDSEFVDGALLKAEGDCQLLNIQIDGIIVKNGGVVVGEKGESLPKEKYKNFTFVNISAPDGVIFNNDYLHAYVK